MGKVFLRPSTKAYDGLNNIEEILGEYQGYLSILSDSDLKNEFKNIKKEWLGSPTVLNVRMYENAKQKMIERGLLNISNKQESIEPFVMC